MKIYQHNQYDTLRSCLLCYPVNFKINDKSNEYYNKINYDLLYSQYNNFVNTLSENDVKINFIDINKEAANQVFTQDIGFVIDDVFFVSNMAKQERKIETPYLMEFIKKHNLKFYEMKNNIEGGDLIYHNKVIFTGISTRTTLDGAKELQEALNNLKMDITVIPIYFDTSKLHLDCVFNILDKDCGVISPYVYDKKIIEKYIPNLYEISKADADTLGTNYVTLGNKKILSSNKNVSAMLKSKGYKVKYIDYSEIMKSEGSLGCSIMYLMRNN